MSRPLIHVLQEAALDLPRFGAIDDAATMLAIVYRDDQIWCKSRPPCNIPQDRREARHLFVVLIRALQDWGKEIIESEGEQYGVLEGFTAAQKARVKLTWDNYPESVVSVVLERKDRFVDIVRDGRRYIEAA